MKGPHLTRVERVVAERVLEAAGYQPTDEDRNVWSDGAVLINLAALFHDHFWFMEAGR